MEKTLLIWGKVKDFEDFTELRFVVKSGGVARVKIVLTFSGQMVSQETKR